MSKKKPDYTGAIQDLVMPAKSYKCVELKKGQIMRVEDLEGVQCADIAFISTDDYKRVRAEVGEGVEIQQSQIEQYSQGMTVNRNRHVYLGKGYTLYSSKCSPMLTITQDTVGNHDVVVAWCNPELNQSRWGDIAIGKRTCKENIHDAYAEYGINTELPFTFNIFMDYSIGEDGEITYGATLSGPGDYIDFKAEMDVIAAISNCPQELSLVNGFKPTSLRVAVFEQEDYVKIEPEAQMEATYIDSSYALEKG